MMMVGMMFLKDSTVDYNENDGSTVDYNENDE